MTDRWHGKRSPDTALSAISQEFSDAYSTAARSMLDAVWQFELTTGRVVLSASVHAEESTHHASIEPESMRMATIEFAPTEAELRGSVTNSKTFTAATPQANKKFISAAPGKVLK